MCKDIYFIHIFLIATFGWISLLIIASWLHHKIKNKTLAQSYKFQTSPSSKILSTNNPNLILHKKFWKHKDKVQNLTKGSIKSILQCSDSFNTCLLNNLLILKIPVEIGILYRILYLPFTKFWFLKILKFLLEQYN